MEYKNSNLSEDERLIIFTQWDTIYRKLKTCNNSLLEKSNRGKKDSSNLIEDSFAFYISSFGLSFIKNLYLHLDDSLGNIINIRCIIEGLAILEYLKSDLKNEEKNNLLELQAYILERNTYKKYLSMDKYLFDIEVIQKNYEEVKLKYKTILDLNSKKFAYLENANIPFIDEHLSFEKIIENTFGNEVKRLYKLLSLLSHPHDFRHPIYNDKDIQILNDITVSLLETKFHNFDQHQGGLETEYDNTLKYSPISSMLREQNKLLKKVCMVINDNGYHALSSYIYELSIMQWDFYLDLALGYTEHATTKWKYFAELFAFMYYSINDFYYSKENQLLYFHTAMNINNFVELNNDTDDWNFVYNEYLRKYPNGVDLEAFKINFKKTLGFLIDEKGATPSLREIVYEMIDNVSSFIYDDSIFNPQFNIKLSDYLKMKYDESQNMSHANGYMLFAPTGAWIDGQNLSVYSDFILNRILDLFLEKEKERRNDNKKTVRNVIRNYIKKSEKILQQKHAFFASPKIPKNF